MAQNNYDAHPDIAKLKPWTEMMFTGDSFSILKYDRDIYSLIKSGLVNVHVGELDQLSASKVHLADGTEFESDVLVANTGWKHVPSIKFLPEGIEAELGIPHQPTESGSAPPQDLANQHALVEAADREILQRFPQLRRQPVWNAHYKPITEQKGISTDTADEVTPYTPLTPYMLYRFMVPASARFLRTRDIAFAGMMSNLSNALRAHICGLWISAFFSGKLAIDTDTDTDPGAPASASASESPEDGNIERRIRRLQYETVLFNRWGKWRYPTDWGTKRPNFVFDAVPCFDLLQRDLGLNQYRKGGWFAEMTQVYGPADYEDITDEWMRKQKD
ncbi:Uu.00g066570.m01.CDS01 [Anthostomella pinea]|uniref:Uu.00g066570.m01.CDS01 n=1 Tax=Anthostomella pinea TaxID=933095 RepID=A0AAI8VTY2_9PEZI|nr:Uu.00g066570.m01.CDS01 [Anthostomella pinea]